MNLFLLLRCAGIALLTCAITGGCAKNDPAPVSTAAPAAKHEHKAPHGGTPVVLGEELYHVELVRDAATGTLQAFLLDGEMENFIRAAMPSFEAVANVNGTSETLVFKPIANSATGETIGDTALFEAQAEWLKKTAQFDAVFKTLAIRGRTFADVTFNFPKGNDKD